MKPMVTEAIKIIHRKFENKQRIPVKDLEGDLVGFSRKILMRARNLLKIDSRKFHNSWYWMHPKVSLKKALYLAKGKEKDSWVEMASHDLLAQRALRRTSVLTLKLIMEAHNGSCPAIEAIEDMRAHSVSKVSADRAKRVLNLTSVWYDHHWWWVTPAPHLEEWLREFVNAHAARVSFILSTARDAGWTPAQVYAARARVATLRDLPTRQGPCWYNISIAQPPLEIL